MKLWNWIVNLSTAAKVITGIIAFIILISSGVIWFKGYVIERHEEEKVVKQRQTEVTELRDGFVEINNTLLEFNKAVMDSIASLSLLARETNRNVDKHGAILIGVRNHMVKSATKEDIIEIFKIWEDAEKKKNGTGLLETVPGPLILPIQ